MLRSVTRLTHRHGNMVYNCSVSPLSLPNFYDSRQNVPYRTNRMFQDDIGAITKAVPIARKLCFGTPDQHARRQNPPCVTPTSYSAARQRVTAFDFCHKHVSEHVSDTVHGNAFPLDDIVDSFICETPEQPQTAMRYVDLCAKRRVEATLRKYPVVWKRSNYFFRQFVMRKANVSDEQLDNILYIRVDIIRAQ